MNFFKQYTYAFLCFLTANNSNSNHLDQPFKAFFVAAIEFFGHYSAKVHYPKLWTSEQVKHSVNLNEVENSKITFKWRSNAHDSLLYWLAKLKYILAQIKTALFRPAVLLILSLSCTIHFSIQILGFVFQCSARFHLKNKLISTPENYSFFVQDASVINNM